MEFVMDPHRPRHTSTFFIALAVLIVGLGFWSGDAFARPPMQTIDVRFDHVAAKQKKGALDLSYRIEKGDWKKLRYAHIRPKLNVYRHSHQRGAEFVTSVDITEREGVIYLKGFERTDEIQVRLSGHHRGKRIGDMGYKKQCAKRITVAVHHPASHGVGWSKTARKRLLASCGKFGMNVNACFPLAKKYGEFAPAAFEACSAASDWRSDFTSCIDNSKAIRGKRVAKTIASCDRATEWASDFRSCLKLSANLNQRRAKTIDACDAATQWSSEFRSCMKLATAYTRAAPVIDACSAQTQWSSEFTSCMKGAVQHRNDAAEIVNFCGEQTEWSSEFNRCLKRGGFSRHHASNRGW